MLAARIAVQRADSLRSERSDASQANKRVSFNHDIDVKHINHQKQQRIKGLAPLPPPANSNSSVAADRHDIPPVSPFYNVYKEPTSLSEAELAQEAERIIQQVDQISCTVSPTPLLANYETRSLERRNLAKRNNQQVPHQQDGNWSRTLPTASTKNQLLDSTASKKNKNVEKNNILHQQQQQGPQRVAMTVEEHQNREAATTPPKYDSGIEMEASSSRPNVNLIVQQLKEEARQREVLRRKYQEQVLSMTTEDPLAPRLPTLNLVEPDAQLGLSHNKNLPFSYTGGASPTRISPLRSPGGRFSSPPPRPELPGKAAAVDAQARDQSQSPERNVFRSNETDKVPARGKFSFQQQQQSEVIRQHLHYPDDEEDLDVIKAKARFLFGDDGLMQKERRKLSDGMPMDVHNNNRNGITINNNIINSAPGLSYKYSTLLQDRTNEQQPDVNQSYTTKILIGSGQQQRKRQEQERQVFQYSDEDDFGRGRGVYHDRSVSPEPHRIQPLASRIRSLHKQSSPDRYRPEQESEIRTLPLINKKAHQVMASTRLIQEAERGRTAVRSRPAEFTSVQQRAVNRYVDELDGGPPKPPLRVKKLSRERTEASTPRVTKQSPSKVAFNTTVPWNRSVDPGNESSPERSSYPLPRPSTNKKMPSPYRYQPPSPERGFELRRWNEPLGQESDTTTTSRKVEPEKREKIRRQRSKFLSVFLGSKANKSKAPLPPSSSVIPPAPAAATKTMEVRGQPPVAKWSAEDEAELVRQSRSLLVKGQSHQSTARIITEPTANKTKFVHRKMSPPSEVDPRYRVVTSKDVVGHRRRNSTDRTDTSESDEVNHQRFKNLRQKSQSFNNLDYRPDPVVVLGEEHQPHRHRANDNWPRHLDDSQFISSRRYPENEVAVDGRYRQQPQQREIGGDARPYASTNLIHQMRDEETIKRPAVVSEEEPQRQMRYFGDTDLESHGGYSTRYQPKAKVLRSASTAAGMGAVRRGVLHRGQKPPVSSVNSSESAASAESQRSVYLHATTVADIPTVIPVTNRAAQLQAARRKAQSREDMSALSGTTGSTLRRTRQISRSYSVLAPWKPRHYRDKFEITYSNQQQPAAAVPIQPVVAGDAGKPPRAPIRRREDVIMESEDSADVYRPDVAQRQQTSSKTGTPVSRSSTMPKNTKLMAGWFRKKKQR